MPPPDVRQLAERVVARDRRALARAITLVESRRADDRAAALELLDRVLPVTGRSMRVAVSGAPGAGKSTLIEALGVHVVDSGSSIAVLAIDPTSRRSGGSILGDKTRMSELSRRQEAFVRPTPAGDALGGVAHRTRDALLLCEAAGFDVVLVETVGIGQSETAVVDLVDTFVLLVAPGGGDELQGIKRGVMELADIVAVTKVDGDLRAAGERAAADVAAALRFVRPRLAAWTPVVSTVSSVERSGLAELWAQVLDHRARLVENGELDRLRAEQAVAWFRQEATSELLAVVRARVGAARLGEIERDVRDAKLSPARAARALVEALGQPST